MAEKNRKKGGCFRAGCLTLVVGVLLFAGIGVLAHQWGNRLPGRFVLRVPVSGAIDERSPDAASLPFGGTRQTLSLEELLTILDRAKTDKRVDSVLLQIDGLNAPAAKVQELGNSIADLRKSGKKVTALLNTPGDKEYRLAAACDSIIVQKGSWMLLDGLKAELFFFAEPLEKLGVSFQAAQWKKYKSAVESFTRSSASPENLEETNALLDDAWADYLDSVSRQRRVSREAFRSVVDSLAVLTPEKALSLRLVDRVATERELDKEYEERLGKPADELFVEGREYLDATGGMRPQSIGDRIAVVAITGMIVSDGSAEMGDGEATDVATLKQALQTALDDTKVKAIVLRIDSPGGDALAASTMLELLEEAKTKKPIVASMSGVAASGGYMVALAGSKIYAEPMTVTGSIGVFSLKPDFGGLLEKSGIRREVLTRGRFADAYTPFKPFDDASFRKFVETAGTIYDDFIAKVAKGRRMTPAEVDAVAGGRVWSGKRALEVGLIDRIGGLDAAVQEAKKLARMDAKAKPELLYLPVRKTWLEYLLAGDASQLTSALAAGIVRQSLGELQPLANLPGTRTARFLLRTEAPQVLALDPVEVEIK
ncbi:signal peptide peptidase SppA [Chlorobaculum limnaeum]|uniref:Signal peptide peptidase SppA n=1 Tax=Chlorobaculum limnaeum TaxID=274537 RepID=A0A1D8CZ73_CHLLM|nr:signal peptide peptidase SppA [Chlorobaculum limnaeum]AOS83103.1 signal peptide peptidase SppA [Chlorobaculum limnaeum]